MVLILYKIMMIELSFKYVYVFKHKRKIIPVLKWILLLMLQYLL